MRKIFHVYLTNEMSTSGRSATLDLPASDYEMLDMMDKIQLRQGDSLYWDVEDFYDFDFLAPFLSNEASLYDLNYLSKQLSMLGIYDSIAFEGLVRMDEADGKGKIGIDELINLAHSVDDCHVVDAINDTQLGRFYADNDFMPELDQLSDNLYDKLDFAKIGREMREAEHGVFTSRGYVLHTQEVRQVYQELDTKPKKPDYVLRLDLISTVTAELAIIKLPNSAVQLEQERKKIGLDSWRDAELHAFDGAIRGLNIDLRQLDAVDDLNRLAKRVRQVEQEGNLTKYKAILAANECTDVVEAVLLADKLDDYFYEPDTRTPEDLARAELEIMVSPENLDMVLRHMDLGSYGQEMVKRDHSVMTAYGAVTPNEVPEQTQTEPRLSM